MDSDGLSWPILMDGATGTGLYRRGMPAGACTEQWVLEHPEALIGLQKEYIEAGAQVLTAPTFGANRARLAQYGIQGRAAGYSRRLAALSQKAAGGRARVAADLGPTGLSLAPFGGSGFEELVEIYAEQVQALEDTVDLFLVETAITMAEARAAVLAVRAASRKPVWVCFTCDENGRTPSGTDVLAALIVMQGMGAAAFGINCSDGPETVLAQLRRLAPYAAVPLIAMPGAGLPDGQGDYPYTPEDFAALVPALAAAGVRIFGGCCGSAPAHIAALGEAAARVDFSAFPPPERDPDVIPCASEKEARFITPDVDVGETIECTPDLPEHILEAEEDRPQGALKIAVLEEDDLDLFSENQYMVKDALCLWSDVPELLEGALRAYQGRAFWDGTGDLEPAFLEEMRQKYGLILL